MTTQDIADKGLIYKTKVGSTAYGTSLPGSDIDYAGVFIPPIEYYFGIKAFDILNEQTDEDKCYYSIRKFAQLAIANNPNVLELLYTDPTDIIQCSESFQRILQIRDKFLSKRCGSTYIGYASAQLHRIKSHSKWIAQEEKAMAVILPMVLAGQIRKSWIQNTFGPNLVERIEQEINKLDPTISEQWNANEPTNKTSQAKLAILLSLSDTGLANPQQDDETFYSKRTMDTFVFDEAKFKLAKKKRGQYMEWMANRDHKRHETEIKYGYDTKHGMHLVRLLRTGYEVLTEGKLRVYRPDREELLDIRNGKWSYDQITQYADKMIEETKNIKEIVVPDEPDIKLIEQTVIDITRDALLKE